MPLPTAHDAVKKLIDHMTSETSATRLDLEAGEQIAVILNNLGGTSKLEELILAREIVTQVDEFYILDQVSDLIYMLILIFIGSIVKLNQYMKLSIYLNSKCVTKVKV